MRVIDLQELPINEAQRRIRNIMWEGVVRINNIDTKSPHYASWYQNFMINPRAFVNAFPYMKGNS